MSEIIELYDESCWDCVGFMTYGFLDPAKFCEAINEKYGDTLDPAKVKTGLYRWVPCRNKDFSSILTKADKPGRGVFKCTYIGL